MPVQQSNDGTYDIERIRERLRNARVGRRKPSSIASLVEKLRTDIAEQRSLGATWAAIAKAILDNEARQGAIRSAYRRLPSDPPAPVVEKPPRKVRSKTSAHSLQKDVPVSEPPPRITRFDLNPIIDNHCTRDS